MKYQSSIKDVRHKMLVEGKQNSFFFLSCCVVKEEEEGGKQLFKHEC